MKNTIIVGLAIFAGKVIAGEHAPLPLAAPTQTKVVKSNRGLFGYEYVTQTESSGGGILLACSQPGFKDCKIVPSSITTPGGLPTEEGNEIQNLVDSLIEGGQTAGNFVYGDNFLVIYSFDSTIDETEIDVYTKDEAAELGFEL